MSGLYKSFLDALKGLCTVWREERNFRIEITIAIIVIFIAAVNNFSLVEWLFILTATTIVLTAEIVNTSIEDLCNKIEPGEDTVIGKIKDTMAAFVLVSAAGAAIIGVITFTNHFVY